jgi:uncharacterized membrane protein YbhN (UPF0104 family)
MNIKNAANTTRYAWLKLALKIVVSGVCIGYISTKIDFSKAGSVVRQADGWYLFTALLFFIGSKWVSAIRLQQYFSNIHLPVSNIENLRLYWLGMFYNLFLPGAISGDIYKVLLLSKKYRTPYKLLTGAVLLDRFSGLLGLGILLAWLAFFAPLPSFLPWLLCLGAVVSTLLFYSVLRKFFPDFRGSFSSTLLLGLAVQAIQLAAVYLIMRSLDINLLIPAYLFLFLLSSAAAVLPLSIGGLGIRELVFLQGATFFHTNGETAVLVSLLFYLITLMTSGIGAVWLFKNPLNEKGPSDEPLIS